jgi:Tfp pilus assembly protein FimV
MGATRWQGAWSTPPNSRAGKTEAVADGTVVSRNETEQLRWEVRRLETTLNNMRALIPGLSEVSAPELTEVPTADEPANETNRPLPASASIHDVVAHAAAARTGRPHGASLPRPARTQRTIMYV